MSRETVTQKSRADLRLVKCPRCAKILPEPKQVFAYACGGCNTVLQAKYYRKDNNATGSSLHRDDSVQNNGIAQALSGGESDGSGQRSSSAGRQSLDQNEERDQNPVVNYNSKQIETANAAYHTVLSIKSRQMSRETMTQKSRADLRLVKCPRCATILLETKQVSVYACGGCKAVLRAKYYRMDNNATGSSLHRDDGVQSNGIAQALSGGESDGSSQRSSSAGRQSLDQNEERDQNPVVNYDSKQIETANAAYHTSLSDESSFLGNEENGETDGNTDQFNQRDCVVDSNEGHLGAVSPANRASLTESLIVEGCTQKQMGDLDSSEDTSMLKEHQKIENTKLEQFDIVNGAKKDQDDQLQQFDDTASGKHKQVREASSSGEASMLDESLGIQNNERFKSAPENKLLRVNNKRKEGDDLVECLSKKLVGMKLDEAPSPTKITRVRDENSTVTFHFPFSFTWVRDKGDDLFSLFFRYLVKRENMTQKSRVYLRLVKCPRCAKILPEPKQVSVYACGGCKAVLRVSHRRRRRPSPLSPVTTQSPATRQPPVSRCCLFESCVASSMCWWSECCPSVQSCWSEFVCEAFTDCLDSI